MKNLTGRQDMDVLSAVGPFLSNSGRYEVNLQQMRIVVYNSVLTKQGVLPDVLAAEKYPLHRSG